MGRQIQYTVSLNQEEKLKLREMSRDNSLSARIVKRVHILLALDSKEQSNLSYRQIAAALHTTPATIVATAKNYFEKGLEDTLSHHFNTASIRTRKVNGELEAYVIQLACGQAPQGRAE